MKKIYLFHLYNGKYSLEHIAEMYNSNIYSIIDYNKKDIKINSMNVEITKGAKILVMVVYQLTES